MKKSTFLAILMIAVCITTGMLIGCQSKSSQLAELKQVTVEKTKLVNTIMVADQMNLFKVVYDTYSGVFVDTLYADRCKFGKEEADFYIRDEIKTHYKFTGSFVIIAY